MKRKIQLVLLFIVIVFYTITGGYTGTYTSELSPELNFVGIAVLILSGYFAYALIRALQSRRFWLQSKLLFIAALVPVLFGIGGYVLSLKFMPFAVVLFLSAGSALAVFGILNESSNDT
tara:strand:- start:250 stop:606 length:357 start_codon:yes stop_codon:yes gene_type:complete